MRNQHSQPILRQTSSRGRSAFTLVELILSVTIMGILMTGLASAIVIVTYAVPSGDSLAITIVDAAEVSDQIVEELRPAIWITEHTGTSVAFTVADRDGDYVPERIRYEWSAAPGDPLMREYNGGAAIAVLEDVTDFALSYEILSVSEEYPGAVVEGPEEVLSHFDTFDEEKDKAVEHDKWSGQYFEPALPGDAISWRVTRAAFVAKRENGDNDLGYVRLRDADDNHLPTDVVIEEVEMYESTLAEDWEWKEIAFSNAGGLSPNQALCLVWEHPGSGGQSGKIRYEDHYGAGRLWTDHSGTDWEYFDDNVFYHFIYGTVSTPGPPQTATRYYVTSIQLALEVGDESSAYLVTAAQALNSPELLSAMWETAFDSAPLRDQNGDSHPDWALRGGGFFNAGSLDAGGFWNADATLDTYPDNDFLTLTTAEVRLRSTSVGAAGAVFRINADWSGSSCASIVVRVQLQADNTQIATVSHMVDSMSAAKLVMVSGLSDDFVTIRLLIDPSLDTVNVSVAGEDRGTYTYATIAPAENIHAATIYADGGSAEFDYVSIRVSE